MKIIIKKIKWLLSILNYLIKSYLYDLRRGTNTQILHISKSYSSIEKDEIIYMGSIEEEIEESTKKIEDIISKELVFKSNLVDLGSGKGKVLLTWRKMYPKSKRIYGIEYNKGLNSIAEKNFQKLNYKSAIIKNTDASLIKIPELNKANTIFFMYNPFGPKTIKNFFNNNSLDSSAIIYFNPLHSDLLESLGYINVFQKYNYRMGSTYKIFIKGIKLE